MTLPVEHCLVIVFDPQFFVKNKGLHNRMLALGLALQKAFRRPPLETTFECRRDPSKELLLIIYNGLLIYAYHEIQVDPTFAIVKVLIDTARLMNRIDQQKYLVQSEQSVAMATQFVGSVRKGPVQVSARPNHQLSKRILFKYNDRIYEVKERKEGADSSSLKGSTLHDSTLQSSQLPLLSKGKRKRPIPRNTHVKIYYSKEKTQKKGMRKVQLSKSNGELQSLTRNSNCLPDEQQQDLRQRSQRRHQFLRKAKLEQNLRALEESKNRQLQQLNLSLQALYNQITGANHSHLIRDCCRKVLQLVREQPEKAVREIALLTSSNFVNAKVKSVLCQLLERLTQFIQMHESERVKLVPRATQIEEVDEKSSNNSQKGNNEQPEQHWEKRPTHSNVAHRARLPALRSLGRCRPKGDLALDV